MFIQRIVRAGQNTANFFQNRLRNLDSHKVNSIVGAVAGIFMGYTLILREDVRVLKADIRVLKSKVKDSK
ncbi:hypothetical protein AB751O23_AC_00380 [Chlamydiales bacterium SCGC AB-751-O23]|jgi:hypothetical protein|nr:hypothetical protein AB751O23_AC_00380 [Chlamydiales bacterium SCGC AB-751-O23]